MSTYNFSINLREMRAQKSRQAFWFAKLNNGYGDMVLLGRSAKGRLIITPEGFHPTSILCWSACSITTTTIDLTCLLFYWKYETVSY